MILTVATLQARRALVRYAAAKRDRTTLRARVASPGAAPREVGLFRGDGQPSGPISLTSYVDENGQLTVASIERGLRRFLEEA